MPTSEPATPMAVTPELVRESARTLAPFIRRTPVIEWSDAGGKLPGAVLKLELLQHSGSFKARGAFMNLLRRPVPAGGVVAASGGNHGAAVAYAARRLGVPATIFVPRISSPAKMERIRGYGAELVVVGGTYAEAYEASESWATGREVLAIHAYDQMETILGQATLALELAEQVPDAGAVLVPVGGGGLLAGIAAWYGRSVRLFGVEPESAPTLARALEAGRVVDVAVDAAGVAADSLAPRHVGTRVFDIVQPVVAGALLVRDDEILAAQRFLWESLRIVAEAGGATAFAALLSGRFMPRAGESVVVILSGGNTTAVDFPAHMPAAQHARRRSRPGVGE